MMASLGNSNLASAVLTTTLAGIIDSIVDLNRTLNFPASPAAMTASRFRGLARVKAFSKLEYPGKRRKLCALL
jgi:hypothetical protein